MDCLEGSSEVESCDLDKLDWNRSESRPVQRSRSEPACQRDTVKDHNRPRVAIRCALRAHEGVWASLLAGAAVLAAVVSQREVAIGLILLGVCFLLIERALRRRDQPAFRKSMGTDCVHFLCGEMLAAPVVVVTMLTVGRSGRMLVPGWFHATVQAQSAPVRYLAACVIGELSSYWGHRLLHGVPLLWRVHKVHHSIDTMDWLAPSRHHPLDLAFSRLSVAVPLMVLGFSVPSIGAPFVVRRVPGLLVHANIRLRYGSLLRAALTSPEFHHWHHSANPEHHNKNFAGSFPIVDKIFGTLHFGDEDSGHWPSSYGITESTPETWGEQMLWPFQRPCVAQSSVFTDCEPGELGHVRWGT